MTYDEFVKSLGYETRTDDSGQVVLFDPIQGSRVHGASGELDQLREAYAEYNEAQDSSGRPRFGTAGYAPPPSADPRLRTPNGSAGGDGTSAGVTIGGNQYSRRKGDSFDELMRSPEYAEMARKAGVTANDFIYDPQYGNLSANNERTGQFWDMVDAKTKAENDANGPAQAFSQTIGPAMGIANLAGWGLGALANNGVGWAASMLPEGGYTSLMSSLADHAAANGGGFGQFFTQSPAPVYDAVPSGNGTWAVPGTDAPWGVNPQYAMSDYPQLATTEYGLPDFSQAPGTPINPGANMTGFMTPANALTAGGAAASIASAAGGAGGAVDGISPYISTAGGATGPAASGGGGGMWDGFVSNLLKPSTLLGALPIAGQVASAVIGSNAIRDAARTQADSVAAANTLQAPWLQAGGAAIRTLADRTIGPNADLTRRFTMSDLNADPVYQTSRQFGADEGRKAIERAMAASGRLDSGAAGKAISRFATDYAGTKANDSFNRYESQNQNIYNKTAGVAGTGQVAANQVGSNTMSGGNAQAAAGIGQANLVTNAAGNVSNFLQNQQILNRLPIYTMS